MSMKKINQTRRQRGYAWETEIVKRFKAKDGWHAMRLGGATTHLPDLVLINNKKSMMIAVECKSGTGNKLYVPKAQVDRCNAFLKHFTPYSHRAACLAFKFSTVKRITSKMAAYRPKKEYMYMVWDELKPDCWSCNYAGRFRLLFDDGGKERRLFEGCAQPTGYTLEQFTEYPK